MRTNGARATSAVVSSRGRLLFLVSAGFAISWLPAACSPAVEPRTAAPGDEARDAGESRELLYVRGLNDAAFGEAGRRALDAGFELGNGMLASTDQSDAGFSDDPMATHKDTREELLSLFALRPMTEAERTRVRADAILDALVGIGAPTRMNQGNKAIALHTTSKRACLEGLRGVTIQTPEDRALCGADNMVPVWRIPQGATAASDAGSPDAGAPKPAFCIDEFEFPNQACELPFVWVSPSSASTMCKLQGKRLCMQPEWQLACRADPEGGKDQRYAYGNKLDLDVCHTHRPHRQRCVSQDAKTVWATCTTDTEPSGSFPKCRSRFGVFDMHGNVAEIMERKDTDGTMVSQLKGSAWFYSELAREPDQPIPESTPFKESAHPDHCNFDPRWHVENIDSALHVNYHLGFRCCKSI